MAIDRRSAIKAGIVLGASLAFPAARTLYAGRPTTESAGPTELFIGGAFKDSKPCIAAATLDGNIFKTLPTEARLHECIPLDNKRVVIIGRSPSTVSYELNLADFTLTDFKASSGAHFLGHGAVADNGRYLYTTEHRYASDGHSVITVRDTTINYGVVKTFEIPGIGAHDIALLPDGDTLITAIGGIKTHPDFPGQILNPQQIVSGVVYINRHTGQIVQYIECPYPNLSLRHIAVSAQGDVYIAAQYQGFATDSLPLVAHHLLGNSSFRFFNADSNIWARHNQYIGSIVLDQVSGYLYTSSPRGDLLSIWTLKDHSYATSLDARDICALGNTSAGDVYAGSGKAELRQIQGTTLINITNTNEVQWDNHATIIQRA